MGDPRSSTSDLVFFKWHHQTFSSSTPELPGALHWCPRFFVACNSILISLETAGNGSTLQSSPASLALFHQGQSDCNTPPPLLAIPETNGCLGAKNAGD